MAGGTVLARRGATALKNAPQKSRREDPPCGDYSQTLPYIGLQPGAGFAAACADADIVSDALLVRLRLSFISARIGMALSCASRGAFFVARELRMYFPNEYRSTIDGGTLGTEVAL